MDNIPKKSSSNFFPKLFLCLFLFPLKLITSSLIVIVMCVYLCFVLSVECT